MEEREYVDRRHQHELSKEKPVDENNEADFWKYSTDELTVQVVFS